MEEKHYAKEIKQCLQIAGLTEREQGMLLKYLTFDDDKYSKVALAKIYNLSHERVRCIINAALERLSLDPYQINIANLLNSHLITQEHEYYFLFKLLTDFSLIKLFDLPEYFPNCELDLVRCAFNRVSKNYPEFKQIYNDDLVLILKDRELIKPLIQKFLPEMYNTIVECKKHPLKLIYDYLPLFNKNDIDQMLKKLKKEEKQVINLFTTYTGRDIITPEQKSSFYRVVKKLRKMLFRTSRKHQCRNIYEFFLEFTPEQVDDAIRLLPLNYRQAIVERFNRLYQNTDQETEAIYSLFYYQVIPRIQKLLQDPAFYESRSYLTIYDYFKEYTKEEVKEAILKLSNKDQKVVYLRFGNDLDNQKVNYDWNSFDEHQFYHWILSRITSIIKQKKVTKRRSKNLFEILAKDSTSQVLYIIQNNLTSEELQNLAYYFGEDYQNYNDNLTEQDKQDCSNLCLKIKRLLSKEYKMIGDKKLVASRNIYQLFNKYTSYSVNEAIKLLSQTDYDLLLAHYEGDLMNIWIKHDISYDEQAAFSKANYHLKVILQKYFEPLENYSISLLDYFNYGSIEEGQKQIDCLSSKDKELMVKRFGLDYQGKVSEIYFTLEERIYFYDVLLPSININNNDDYEKQIEKVFNKPFALVQRVIDILPKDYRLILFFKYNINKNRQYFSNQDNDHYCLHKKIIPLINKILIDEELYQYYTYSSIYQYFPDFSVNEVNNVINNLNDKDKMIINLRFGNDLAHQKVNYDWKSSEAGYFFQSLVKQIKIKLYKMRRQYFNSGLITDFVGDYSLVEIKKAIAILKVEEQDAIYIKFGPNLDKSYATRIFNYEMTMILTSAINNLQNILNYNMQKAAENNSLTRARSLE